MQPDDILANAIKQHAASQIPADTKIEGNSDSWHIRFVRRVGAVELWSLFQGNECQSSPTIKETAQKWMLSEMTKTGAKAGSNERKKSMQPDDISSADLGNGAKLSFQTARNGTIVRAVVKDAAGATVAVGDQVPRAQAQRSRFDATSKYLAAKSAAVAVAQEAAFVDDEDEDDEDEDYL